MDWIDLAQGRDNGWDLENTTKKFGLHKMRGNS